MTFQLSVRICSTPFQKKASAVMPEVQLSNSTSLPTMSDFINGAPPSSIPSRYDDDSDLFPQPMLDCESGLVPFSGQVCHLCANVWAEPNNRHVKTSPGTESNTQHIQCDTDLIGTIQCLSGQTAIQAAAHSTLVHAHEALVRDSILSDQNRNAAISHANMLQDQLRQAQCSLSSYHAHIEELRRDIKSKNETIRVLRDHNSLYAEQQGQFTRVLLNIAQSRSSQDNGRQAPASWHGFPTSGPTTVPDSQSYLPETNTSTSLLTTPMQPAETPSTETWQSLNYIPCHGQDSMLQPLAARTDCDQDVVPAPRAKSRTGKKARGQ